jgi:hypothetical protein
MKKHIPSSSQVMLRILSLALLAAASAKAATTLEFTNSAVDFAGNTNWTALTLPQFDPAQGQLTGVTITVNSLTYGGSFNVRSSVSDFEVTVDSALGVGAIRSTGLGYNGWARAGDGLVLSPSTQFGYIIDPGANQTFNISPFTIYDDPTSIGSSFFASYTGTGLVTFEVRNSNTRVTTYPDIPVLINYDLASVTANMTVTYTYAPIPEPTTSLLGLLGTALLFRRRRV